MPAAGRPRGASVLALAAGALPLLAALYQIAAAMTARACIGATGISRWLEAAAATPWCAVLIGSEIASFLLWTAVLARMPLARAFPLTAIGYVVAIVAGALVLHQPIGRAALIGSIAILAGAALLATDAA